MKGMTLKEACALADEWGCSLDEVAGRHDLLKERIGRIYLQLDSAGRANLLDYARLLASTDKYKKERR